ncbi:MAG: tetratricopeptide repeat protein [Candidatus Marinimicrobia bacterium]|nr:tetratricopeptide repeat protein [Candidatus Neomarinimicrobiota bacterium]MCF7830229.1 tetratricopeptide repeat protein [Candidatus Neomarinimicrobiota bacterium]MCF7882256.1 tetratricopeptide repeat protein [Candidatus Neomarinimicrobiota bacterium]
MIKELPYITVIFIFITGALFAQQDTNDARTALRNGNFEEAVVLFKNVVKEEPGDPGAWFGLGRALHSLEQYNEAISAYHTADSLGFYPQFLQYNLACVYALSGQKPAAFRALQNAIQAGYSNAEHMQEDSDLNSLREEKQFIALVEQADRNARPCEYDSLYRQLDFWIGEWDVYNPQGQMVGHNTIMKTANGCMLLENWKGTGGSNGKSMNFVHPETGQWRQQWVGGSGYIIEYTGEFSDGAMRFSGKNIQMNGTTSLSRMTLTPREDGTVHQLIEQSDDDGKTWQVWFDGTYKPVDGE